MRHIKPAAMRVARIQQVARFGKTEGHRAVGLDRYAHAAARVALNTRRNIEAEDFLPARVDPGDGFAVEPFHVPAQSCPEQGVNQDVRGLRRLAQVFHRRGFANGNGHSAQNREIRFRGAVVTIPFTQEHYRHIGSARMYQPREGEAVAPVVSGTAEDGEAA